MFHNLTRRKPAKNIRHKIPVLKVALIHETGPPKDKNWSLFLYGRCPVTLLGESERKVLNIFEFSVHRAYISRLFKWGGSVPETSSSQHIHPCMFPCLGLIVCVLFSFSRVTQAKPTSLHTTEQTRFARIASAAKSCRSFLRGRLAACLLDVREVQQPLQANHSDSAPNVRVYLCTHDLSGAPADKLRNSTIESHETKQYFYFLPTCGCIFLRRKCI